MEQFSALPENDAVTVEMLGYQRVKHVDASFFPDWWSLHLRVDGLFEVKFPLPIIVKPKDFQKNVDAKYEEIVELCKGVYGSVHVELERVKARLTVTKIP